MKDGIQLELIEKFEGHNAKFLCTTSIHNYYRAYKRLQSLIECKNSNIHKDITKLISVDNTIKSMAIVFTSLGGGHNISNALIFDISEMETSDLENSGLSTIAISPHNDVMGRDYGSFGFLVDIMQGNDFFIKINDPYWKMSRVTKDNDLTDTTKIIRKKEVKEYLELTKIKYEFIFAEKNTGINVLLKWNGIKKEYIEVARFNDKHTTI